MASEIEADVVIVGAGPTGLTTANALGMRGVHTIVIERNPGTVGEPRAVSIDDESLRIMQAIGLIDGLLPKITLGYGARYYSPAHREFARIKPTTLEYGFPRRSAFHQVELEALLLKGLSRFPSVEIRFHHIYQRFEQDAKGVTAVVTDADGNELRVRARYLAACDGGRSKIRQEIGVELKGTSFEERWLVIDCINDNDDTPDSVAYCDHLIQSHIATIAAPRSRSLVPATHDAGSSCSIRARTPWRSSPTETSRSCCVPSLATVRPK